MTLRTGDPRARASALRSERRFAAPGCDRAAWIRAADITDLTDPISSPEPLSPKRVLVPALGGPANCRGSIWSILMPSAVNVAVPPMNVFDPPRLLPIVELPFPPHGPRKLLARSPQILLE
jgi:hypothetical protein